MCFQKERMINMMKYLFKRKMQCKQDIGITKGFQSAFFDNLRKWQFLSHFPAILDDKKLTDHLLYLVMTPEKDPRDSPKI